MKEEQSYQHEKASLHSIVHLSSVLNEDGGFSKIEERVVSIELTLQLSLVRDTQKSVFIIWHCQQR